MKGRNEEWRKVSKMKHSKKGKLGLSERRGVRSGSTFLSTKIKQRSGCRSYGEDAGSSICCEGMSVR